jgi:hypothetical protein
MGATGGSGSGSDASSASAGTNRVPHVSQNTFAGGLGVPHLEHCMLVDDGSFAPHALQKREPSRLAVPQLEQ